MPHESSDSKIKFACPHCFKSLRVPRRAIGVTVRCPNCHQEVVVPAPQESSALPESLQPVETDFPNLDQPPPVKTYAPSAASARPPNSSGITPQQIAIFLCAVVGMMGTFMPWVTVPILGSVPGSEGSAGWISFGFFTVALIFAFTPTEVRMWAMIPGLLAGGMAGWKILDFTLNKQQAARELENDPFGLGRAMLQSVHLGAGLYIILLAGSCLAVLAVVLKEKSRSRRSSGSSSNRYQRR